MTTIKTNLPLTEDEGTLMNRALLIIELLSDSVSSARSQELSQVLSNSYNKSHGKKRKIRFSSDPQDQKKWYRTKNGHKREWTIFFPILESILEETEDDLEATNCDVRQKAKYVQTVTHTVLQEKPKNSTHSKKKLSTEDRWRTSMTEKEYRRLEKLVKKLQPQQLTGAVVAYRNRLKFF